MVICNQTAFVRKACDGLDRELKIGLAFCNGEDMSQCFIRIDSDLRTHANNAKEYCHGYRNTGFTYLKLLHMKLRH